MDPSRDENDSNAAYDEFGHVDATPSKRSPPRPASASSTRDVTLPVSISTDVRRVKRTLPALATDAAMATAKYDPLALLPGMRVSQSAHIVLPPRRHAEMLDANSRMSASASLVDSIGSAGYNDRSNTTSEGGSRRIPSQASSARDVTSSFPPPSSFYASPRAEAASKAAMGGRATARDGMYRIHHRVCVPCVLCGTYSCSYCYCS
jgi:hypothetical protein